jgi:hypothetical protein
LPVPYLLTHQAEDGIGRGGGPKVVQARVGYRTLLSVARSNSFESKKSTFTGLSHGLWTVNPYPGSQATKSPRRGSAISHLATRISLRRWYSRSGRSGVSLASRNDIAMNTLTILGSAGVKFAPPRHGRAANGRGRPSARAPRHPRTRARTPRRGPSQSLTRGPPTGELSIRPVHRC